MSPRNVPTICLAALVTVAIATCLAPVSALAAGGHAGHGDGPALSASGADRLGRSTIVAFAPARPIAVQGDRTSGGPSLSALSTRYATTPAAAAVSTLLAALVVGGTALATMWCLRHAHGSPVLDVGRGPRVLRRRLPGRAH